MDKFSEIVVVYNPVSTGLSRENAEYVHDKLKLKLPKTVKIKLTKTQYPGHGEHIGYEYASASGATLIISSSGDGGYHDLINGVLAAGNTSVVTSILPSGNANDHFHATGDSRTIDQLIQTIERGNISQIDVLKITGKINGIDWTRYAHSYAGLGISPVVGKHLNRTKLNFFNEKWLLLRYLFSFRYVKLIIDNRPIKYSSLIFTNIHKMAKVIKLADNVSLQDGKFDISVIRYHSNLRLFLTLAKAVLFGLKQKASMSEFTFKTTEELLIQLDGEVYTLDADSTIKVEAIPKALRCIV